MTSLTSGLPHCYPSHNLTLYGIQRRNYFRHLFSSHHILYNVLLIARSEPDGTRRRTVGEVKGKDA